MLFAPQERSQCRRVIGSSRDQKVIWLRAKGPRSMKHGIAEAGSHMRQQKKEAEAYGRPTSEASC
jgi:hypothetical protein